MSQKPPFVRRFLCWRLSRIEEPAEWAAGEVNLDGLFDGLRAWKARGEAVDDERVEVPNVAIELEVVPEGTPRGSNSRDQRVLCPKRATLGFGAHQCASEQLEIQESLSLLLLNFVVRERVAQPVDSSCTLVLGFVNLCHAGNIHANSVTY